MSADAPPTPAGAMPLPWYVRYTRWNPTSLAEAEAGESRLLSLCKTALERRNVRVGAGKHETMHTISGGKPDGPVLVCLAGYGAGAGFYWRNVDGLAAHFQLHLVDLLGTGMSGRPPFRARSREEAEAFFIDSLAEWKQRMGVGKMILLGHSLGGYLAASYALKHPGDVQHLVLVCPAGMTVKPANEQRTPQWARSPWSLRAQLFRLSMALWDRGVTPGSVIRTAGPWGPRLINGYARNRFKEGMGLSDEEVSAFSDYFYHISSARGSGEHALRHLLGPFAWARHPLAGRLHELQVPCSLIYGEHDWMKPEAGRQVLKEMHAERGKLSPADLQWDVVPQSGHYAFLDRPQAFLARLLKQTRAYLGTADAAEQALIERQLRDGAAEEEAMQGSDARQFDL